MVSTLANSIHRASLDSHYRAKVAILPVGQVPPDKFRVWSKEIKQSGRCIDFANLTFQSPLKDCERRFLSSFNSSAFLAFSSIQPAVVAAQQDAI